MTDIQIAFKYTEADFNEFLWHYVTKERGRRMFMWILVAIIALGFTYWMQGKLNAVMIVSMALVFLLFAGLWRWLLLYNGRRSFSANPQMQEHRQCRIDENGFEMKGESFTSDYEWSSSLRFRETPNLFLVYTTPMSAVIFPKRSFTDAQMETFRALILRVLPLKS